MQRNYQVATFAVLIVVAVGAAGYGVRSWLTAAPTPIARLSPPSPQPAAQPPARPRSAPSFDAVHVGPDGQAVIAGRASPGAEVTVLDRGEAVGHATADANGEWVVTTDKPLPPGAQELSLSARAKGETSPEEPAANLVVMVPEHGAAAPTVAVLLPQGQEPARSVGGEPGRAPRQVALDMVEYDAAGRLTLSGRADPHSTIEAFIGERRLGAATADAEGRWRAEIADGVPVGRYQLRLRARGADAQDAGTLTLALRRAAPQEFGPGGYLAVVPGNSLWHLAQRSYGDGLRYVELYRANRGQIDDPDRIYPGQLLALPAKP